MLGTRLILGLAAAYALVARFQQYRVALREAWEIDYIGTPPPLPTFFTLAVVAFFCLLALAAVSAAVAAWRLRRRRLKDTASSRWKTHDPSRR